MSLSNHTIPKQGVTNGTKKREIMKGITLYIKRPCPNQTTSIR